jgi:hypothetical protein
VVAVLIALLFGLALDAAFLAGAGFFTTGFFTADFLTAAVFTARFVVTGFRLIAGFTAFFAVFALSFLSVVFFFVVFLFAVAILTSLD